jgi:hypothetical protein
MAPPSGTSFRRDLTSPIPHPEKDPRPVVPRNGSIVGGVLARSFADLTSADRAGSPMAPPTLPPPSSADRRPSLFPPALMRGDSFPPLSEERTMNTPSPLRSSTQPQPYSSNHLFTTPFSSEQSRTRPSSPDRQSEPRERRASLTEIIKAETGDDVAMASGRAPGSAHKIEQIEILNSPLVVPSGNMDKTPDGSTDPDGDGEVEETGLEAMEVLAESATRVSEAEEADMDGDGDAEEADQEKEVGGSSGQGSTGGPKYICVHCQKLFSRPSSLRIHTYSRKSSSSLKESVG